jgi:hypothetical protein
MKSTLIIFLIAIFLFSCSNKSENKICENISQKSSSELSIDDIDYKIFNAVLEKYHSDIEFAHILNNSRNRIVVKSVEDINAFSSNTNSVFNDLDQAIFENAVTRNDTIYQFDSNQVPFPLVLLSNEELDCLLQGSNGSVQCYYSKYPNSNGIFKFNRVGVSSSGTQAIVEYIHSETGGCLYFVVLVLRNSKWEAEDRLLLGQISYLG